MNEQKKQGKDQKNSSKKNKGRIKRTPAKKTGKDQKETVGFL